MCASIITLTILSCDLTVLNDEMHPKKQEVVCGLKRY